MSYKIFGNLVITDETPGQLSKPTQEELNQLKKVRKFKRNILGWLRREKEIEKLKLEEILKSSGLVDKPEDLDKLLQLHAFNIRYNNEDYLEILHLDKNKPADRYCVSINNIAECYMTEY